jgi:RNA polymerase sigma factor (sigma-70 family)
MALTNAQAQAIDDLQPYLERIAYKITTHYYPQLDPQDVLQEMNLSLLERAESDPSFLDQAPGYLSRFAAWRGRDFCKCQYDDQRQASLEGYPQLVDVEPDPDRALQVRAALDQLDEQDQAIALAIGAGYTQTEIAASLGYASYRGLHRAMARIRQALAPALGGVA